MKLFLPLLDKKGNIKVDSKLRDKEQIPLTYEGGMEAFFEQEVKPYVPDAIPDYDNAIIGYELSFTKYFYKPVELRPIEDIRADIEAIERDTDGLLDIISEAKAGISRVLTKGLNPDAEMKNKQHAIVAYIQQMENRINKAIAGIEREIELVKEYKTRLVSDVVTGKVDVRDVGIPEK